MVDVVDTGNEGSNGVLGIQAALASLQVQLGNTVCVGMALEAGLGADSVLVTEELLPRGGIGDVRGGHCDKVLVVRRKVARKVRGELRSCWGEEVKRGVDW